MQGLSARRKPPTLPAHAPARTLFHSPVNTFSLPLFCLSAFLAPSAMPAVKARATRASASQERRGAMIGFCC